MIVPSTCRNASRAFLRATVVYGPVSRVVLHWQHRSYDCVDHFELKTIVTNLHLILPNRIAVALHILPRLSDCKRRGDGRAYYRRQRRYDQFPIEAEGDKDYAFQRFWLA